MILASADFGLSFFVELAGLIILGALIYRYIWPHLKRRMNAQLELIRSQFAAGDEAKAEAERLVQERRQALDAARNEAGEIVGQARRSARFLIEDGARRAEEEYGRIVARIAAEIDSARSRARQEVLSELGAVVVSATEIVVRAELDQAGHRRLIDEAIAATETDGAVVA